jgi:hypothetical protein
MRKAHAPKHGSGDVMCDTVARVEGSAKGRTVCVALSRGVVLVVFCMQGPT